MEDETTKMIQRDQHRAKRWGDRLGEGQESGYQTGAPQTTPTSTATEDQVSHYTIPIWIRRKRAAPYTADDPAWKSFQKLKEDKKLMQQIKGEIAVIVQKKLLKGGTLPAVPFIGNISKVGYGFHLLAPIYPPDVYEVPAIFIVPGHITMGWHQLPESIGSKMDRVFHPVMFAEAFYAGLREFGRASYFITKAQILDQLGSGSKPPHSTTTPRSDRLQETLTEYEKAHKRLLLHRLPEEVTKAWLPLLRGGPEEDPSRQSYRNIIKSLTYQGAIESGCAAFHHTLLNGQLAKARETTRGICAFVGAVQFLGERGILFCEVKAIYLPEADAFIGPPIIQKAYILPNVHKWGQVERLESLKADTSLSKAGLPSATLQSAQPSAKEPSPQTPAAQSTDDKNREK